jgi:hypothetical protein
MALMQNSLENICELFKPTERRKPETDEGFKSPFDPEGTLGTLSPRNSELSRR